MGTVLNPPPNGNPVTVRWQCPRCGDWFVASDGMSFFFDGGCNHIGDTPVDPPYLDGDAA